MISTKRGERMNVICNFCSKEFTMKKEMLKEENTKDKYLEIFYNCPNCGKKYLVCVLNNKCRELKKEIKEKSLERVNNKDIDTSLLDREIELARQELKKEMNKINRK